MKIRDVLVGALVLAILGGAFILGFCRWTGRDRGWYQRPYLWTAVLNEMVGPNPLPVMLWSAGLGLGLVSLPLSRYSMAIPGVMFFGVSLPCFVIGLFITMVRPRWALPEWMREMDEQPAADQRGEKP